MFDFDELDDAEVKTDEKEAVSEPSPAVPSGAKIPPSNEGAPEPKSNDDKSLPANPLPVAPAAAPTAASANVPAAAPAVVPAMLSADAPVAPVLANGDNNKVPPTSRSAGAAEPKSEPSSGVSIQPLPAASPAPSMPADDGRTAEALVPKSVPEDASAALIPAASDAGSASQAGAAEEVRSPSTLARPPPKAKAAAGQDEKEKRVCLGCGGFWKFFGSQPPN